MKVEFLRVKTIIDKLPIGYYIGRSVNVILDQSSSVTFYDILNDKIYISYKSINKILEKINKISDKELELLVRSLTYHELSHAMTTPKKLMNNRMEINIVEDERIERKFNGYFRGVDFEKMLEYCDVKGANDTVNSGKIPAEKVSTCYGYVIQMPEVKYEYLDKFFRLVRYHEGPEEFLDKIDYLIRNYSYLETDSNEYRVSIYTRSLLELAKDYYEYLKSQKPEDEEEEEDTEDSDEEKDQSPDPAEEEEERDNNSNENNDESEPEDDEQPVEVDESLVRLLDIDEDSLEEEARKVLVSKRETKREQMKEDFNKYVNTVLINEITSIFNSASKVSKQNSSALNAYSGVFDPRSVLRDDYKYFIQQNRKGDKRGFSKVHLNLFLDRSGSFSPNELIANQLIYALLRVEKLNPNFDFTLITCGLGETIEDKRNIMYSAFDGNDLDEEIWDIFKKVQTPQAINYNIVLFDGIASYGSTDRNFGAFNTSNTLIISDPGNAYAIKEYAPRARTQIIEKNYAEVLIDNLLQMLRILIR